MIIHENGVPSFRADKRPISGEMAPRREAMQLILASDQQNVYRVACEGDITLSDFGVGRDPLQELLDSDYTDCFSRKVILNLEKAKYIDSSGVSWLIRLHKRFQEQGGMLVVHSIPPLIRNVLNLIRVDVVFHIAENEAAAKAMAVSETV
jgi:anti-anti-sigma factor